MNVLALQRQVQAISLLVEGNGIRAVNRLTGIAINTVMDLGYRVGVGCAALHDEMMLGVSPSRIEVDEIWSFVKKKPPRSFYEDDGSDFEEPNTGTRFTFMCLAAEERAIVSYFTGRRHITSIYELFADLRRRVAAQPEFSSDGYVAFSGPLQQYFGSVDYGQVIKHQELRRQYLGRQISGSPVQKRVIAGNPRNISTGRIERLNLTMRTGASRFRRGTNAFSKKLQNHAAAVNLHIFHYNVVRLHKPIKTTPAVKLGIAERPWTVEQLVERALEEFCPTETFTPEAALIAVAP